MGPGGADETALWGDHSPVSVTAMRPGELLLGRQAEIEVLDRLLADVAGGDSRALVVRGEAGVGKTALLRYAASSASSFRVVHAVGIESEMELPFAALQHVCAPVIDRIERLPEPQRGALRVAFGLSVGDPPDRFLLGLAVLSLLSTVAEELPLLCVVDDAQWLDGASTHALAFVARRLQAESLGFLFASRRPLETFTGLPELVIEGLGNGDARAVLGSVVPGPLDERVRDRIISETRGNPLALLELPRGLTAGQLAGGFGLPHALGVPNRIEDSFRRRLELLPTRTRQLLLVAAVEPLGDPLLVWRAAEPLGIAVEDAAPAEAAGLIEFGLRVRFRHPLVRSAIYRAAAPAHRRTAHRALADATDPEIDPDRRAWHRAQASSRPDEDVASELERSATRAQARGGLAAAAAFLEQAAALTPDAARRAARALAASHTKHLAGAPDAALELLAAAQAGPLDQLQRARADLLHAQVAFAVNRGNDAPPLMLKAARQLEPLDLELARDTYMEGITAAMVADPAYQELAVAALAAPSPSQPRPSDLLLDGLALVSTDGYAAAEPMLKRALAAVLSERAPMEEELRVLWAACQAAAHLWDDETYYLLARRAVRLARDAGALSVLPIFLSALNGILLLAGELAEVAALMEEAEAFTDPSGTNVALTTALPLAAFRGREAEVSALVEATSSEAVTRGGGIRQGAILLATGVLYNGLGRYEEARRGLERTSAPELSYWSLSELIEASIRSGDTETAGHALEQLSEMTRAGGNNWGLGIEARCRALLAAGPVAEGLYREAIERLGSTRVRAELARAHLLYGEWLRRERRRLEAREQLRIAQELFDAFGMEAFAARARVELRATGERARKRTPETFDDLTPQEAQISRLAAEGARNQEIAAQLFISPSTVDYHLRKAFRKLGVKSRTQLARHFLQPDAEPELAAQHD
jgi:DNA-binding CsgD family transcriptional regulator